MRWDAEVPALKMRGSVRELSLSGEVRALSLRMGERADVAPEPPPPEPEYFYGVDGGLVRYDARTLEIADGASVASWADVSGQLGDAVQDVVARQPTYTAALPGISFPGTGEHHLRLPAELGIDERTPFTIVMLVNRTFINPPTTGQLIGWGQLSGQMWGLYQLTVERGTWLVGGLQRVGVNGGWPVGVRVVDFELDGVNAVARADGVPMGTPIAIGNVANQNVVPSLGAQLRPDGSVVFPFAGVVHDVMFYDRALSSADLATVRAGLAADWNI